MLQSEFYATSAKTPDKETARVSHDLIIRSFFRRRIGISGREFVKGVATKKIIEIRLFYIAQLVFTKFATETRNSSAYGAAD